MMPYTASLLNHSTTLHSLAYMLNTEMYAIMVRLPLLQADTLTILSSPHWAGAKISSQRPGTYLAIRKLKLITKLIE
ncbi:hypothetical protein E2C01_013968 [Portunus trituberculatus]|uniref:Uncharacterized protein n=1 Tax=Portunus trituberculatus TaxID=210409 RepID=A0A5B7DII1_PORTR|nr:hypothetical protein [Portunus trituberculatus]